MPDRETPFEELMRHGARGVELTPLEARLLHSALTEREGAYGDDPKARDEVRAAIRSALQKLEDAFGPLDPPVLA